MKFALVLAGVVAGLGAALLLTATADEARAQVTGTVNPGGDRAEPAAKDTPPPGGCMPIGVTASGEIVFPFLCKGFIEQHKAASQKPAASGDVGERPAAANGQPRSEEKNAEETSADEKSVTKQPDVVAPNAAEPAKAGQESRPRPAAAEEQRPNGDGKPESAENNSATKPPDGTQAIAKSAPEPVETASPDREHIKPREGSAGPPGCTRFRSYDASSATYMDFGGRRRACRS